MKIASSRLWLWDNLLARIGRLQGILFCFVLSPCLLIENRSIYGHIDFLGQGSTSLLEDVSNPRFSVGTSTNHTAVAVRPSDS